MICRSRWGNKQTVIFSSSDVTTKMLFTLSPHGGLISKNQVYLSLSSNGYYGCSFTEIFQLDTLILILFIYIFLFLTDFYKFISLSWWMHVYGALKTYKTVSYTVPFYRVWNIWLLKDNSFGDFLFFYLFICVCGFFFFIENSLMNFWLAPACFRIKWLYRSSKVVTRVLKAT